MPRTRFLLLLIGLLALTVVAVAAAAPAAQDEPTRRATGPAVDGGVQNPDATEPRSPTACTTPLTQNVRGKNITFDQCYQRDFSHGGTNYSIETYYRETVSATNTAQCTMAENSVGRCEHEISNNDDGNGDNVNAVAIAAEAETAMRFYADRNLTFLPGTTLRIFIGEDPRLGGTPTTASINVDDENVDNNDVLSKRLLAFHEIQHLVQYNYDSATGWLDFFGEGIARSIEDRVDPTLDADTGHLFIPEMNGLLGSETNRTSDLSTINYRSALWWTWLWDQYRTGGEVAPVQGWVAIRNFYTELNTDSDQVNAVRDFISAQGSTFRNDFIDYTLSLFAYRFNPANPRLTYLDNEIRNNTNGLSGHTVINSAPAYSTGNVSMNARSSRYVEFNPASQCDFTTFGFDGNGTNFGFSVMTVDGGNLINRWTSYTNDNWARTVRTADLDRAVGVITAIDQSGTATMGYGCVNPTLIIKNPTTAQFEMVGNANNPRKMIVRLRVQGADGSSVAGLLASDFTVQLRKAGGGPLLPATIINSAYVQDDYWLLVRPPNNGAGAQNGEFYDLIVNLGPQSDTENSSVLYVKRTQDVIVVLDRSGSMTTANKIQAARNAANLFVNELAGDDQGGFVAFDTDAQLREQLAPMAGGHRQDLENAIAAEVPLDFTSIGDGMNTAATEEDAHGINANLCSFVLLSDGYENEPAFWADVQAAVADNGCAIHSIALGPQANEPLMQQIAAAVPGGSYDYADSSGSVPILSPAADDATTAGVLGWENNLGRVYDNKAAQVAGRQRMPWELVRDDTGKPEYYEFYVDETSTELVLSVSWQKPSDNFTYELFDPGGGMVVPDEETKSSYGTNFVLRVLDPKPGYWKFYVHGLDQEFYVSTTAESQFEMYLFVGSPIDELNQGTKVPLLVTFVGPDQPVVGADVRAMVRAPNGLLTTVILHDDGVHGDGEMDDGVYGGYYTVTSFGDEPAPDDKPVEGEAPSSVGSYLVTAVGTLGDLRREAQGSFALTACGDDNQNRLPDCWEKENGVEDPEADPDKDGLITYCEFSQGTDPNDPDTDNGGERDGSEVKGCEIDPNGQDPHDPADDRVGGLGSVHVRPELLDLKPVIVIRWGPLLLGDLKWVDIYRRMVGANGEPLEDWKLIREMDRDNEHVDEDVADGMNYEYLLFPTGEGAGGAEAGGASEGAGPVMASNDPYPPGGSVLINNGDESTESLIVSLNLAADDLSEIGDGGSGDPLPGTPVEALEMRISNSADFAGADWQPFAATVEGWDLGSVPPGETATVYVQFRDEAGNVSEGGMGLSDTIVVEGQTTFTLYMPIARKP